VDVGRKNVDREVNDRKDQKKQEVLREEKERKEK